LLAIAVSVGLVYSVPGVGIAIAYLLGRRERISSSELPARRFAHLAVASPSLFVLIGVIFYLLHSPNSDSVLWLLLWLTALAVEAWTMRQRGAETIAPAAPNPIPLSVAHGTSAALLLLIFLSWHLLNHASAAFSPKFNQATMIILRKCYRSEWVQPVLVTLMLFQVVSGIILLWRATAARNDLYHTLQTSSGAFLAAFIASHLKFSFRSGAHGHQSGYNLSMGFRGSGGSPAQRVERAAHSPLLPRRMARHHPHGTWSPRCAACSPGVAGCSRPCRVGDGRNRRRVRANHHGRTTARPWPVVDLRLF